MVLERIVRVVQRGHRVLEVLVRPFFVNVVNCMRTVVVVLDVRMRIFMLLHFKSLTNQMLILLVLAFVQDGFRDVSSVRSFVNADDAARSYLYCVVVVV